MRLTPGTTAPSLITTDVLGDTVNLASLQGRPVLLSFYRYASCPVCNLRMHSVIQSYPAWAEKGLAVVAVFQSPRQTIAQYVGRQDAPFPIVADPDMVFYKRFGVEARWLGLVSLQVMGAALRAFRMGFAPGKVDGPMHRTPADFLIDAQGRIAVAHYGSNIDDHIALGTITQWLSTQHP